MRLFVHCHKETETESRETGFAECPHHACLKNDLNEQWPCEVKQVQERGNHIDGLASAISYSQSSGIAQVFTALVSPGVIL